MIDIENLEKELNNVNSNLDSIYLLFGEEVFLLESIYKKIKNKFIKDISEIVDGINYTVIEDTNLSTLIQEIETPSFGFEKKLIIVRNSGLLKKEGKKKDAKLGEEKNKLLMYLEENKEQIEESVILIIIENEVDDKHKLYKYINENNIVCKFQFQKPFQIEKRIKNITNAYKVNIDNNTIKYFIECCRNKYARINK